MSFQALHDRSKKPNLRWNSYANIRMEGNLLQMHIARGTCTSVQWTTTSLLENRKCITNGWWLPVVQVKESSTLIQLLELQSLMKFSNQFDIYSTHVATFSIGMQSVFVIHSYIPCPRSFFPHLIFINVATVKYDTKWLLILQDCSRSQRDNVFAQASLSKAVWALTVKIMDVFEAGELKD